MEQHTTTECVAPPPLADENLARFLDDLAEADVIRHIERCAYCRGRAQALAQWQTRAQRQLYRAGCPSPEQLGEYQLGMLTGARGMVLAKHIAECPHCAREFAELRTFMADERPTAETTGTSLRETFGGLFGVLTGQVRPRRSTAQGGVRGNGREPLTIEAGDTQVILDVQPASSGRASVLGQLASEPFEAWVGAQVELWQSGEPPRATTMDDLGTFQLADVLPQAAELLITAGDGRAIHVPSIDLTLS